MILFGNSFVIHWNLSFTAHEIFPATLSCGEPCGLRSEAIRRLVGVAGTKGRVTRVHKRDLRIGAGELFIEYETPPALPFRICSLCVTVCL